MIFETKKEALVVLILSVLFAGGVLYLFTVDQEPGLVIPLGVAGIAIAESLLSLFRLLR